MNLSVVDVHSEHVALDLLQDELKRNPWKLDEKKVGNGPWDPHEGYTPLMSASAFGNAVVVEFLLTLGANKEAQDEVSVSHCSVQIISLRLNFLVFLTSIISIVFLALIDLFAIFVIVCCQNGNTALILAAMKGHIDVVQLLLKNGASIDNKNKVCVCCLFLMMPIN